MLAKIEVLRPFDGTATVEMLGLPHGATTATKTFSKDQTELTFPIAVAPGAAVGKHNGVFCRVTVPENGSTILHQTAMGGTLRIDAPTPAPVVKAGQPPAKPAAVPVSKEPAKPLSRLEQLREKAK